MLQSASQHLMQWFPSCAFLHSLAVVFTDSRWVWLWVLVFNREEKSSPVVLLQKEISAEINPGCGLVSCLGQQVGKIFSQFLTGGVGGRTMGGLRPAAITSDPQVKRLWPFVPFLCFKGPLFYQLCGFLFLFWTAVCSPATTKNNRMKKK